MVLLVVFAAVALIGSPPALAVPETGTARPKSAKESKGPECEGYLKHVLEGDYGRDPKRQVSPAPKIAWTTLGDMVSMFGPEDEKPDALTVIKGGLHTFSGTRQFLNLRPDLVELGQELLHAQFYPSSRSLWYYLTTDPYSGVGYLRLPKTAFHKTALKNLWEADVHFQGGYLWKTLFPEDYTAEDIQAAVRSVVEKPDESENRGWASKLIGHYAKAGQRQITLAVIVDNRSGKVISAYPNFTQRYGSWHKNTTSVGKSSILIRDDYRIEDGRADSFFERIRRVTNVPRGSFLYQNWLYRNSGWDALPRHAKERYIQEIFKVVTSPAAGHIGVTDSLATREIPAYEPGSVFQSAFSIVESVLRDRDFSPDAKVNFLAMQILNHAIHYEALPTDLIWAKYILQRTFDFMATLEMGHQIFLIQAIEDSPIFWTLLQPAAPWNGKDPVLLAARLTASLGPVGIFQLGPEHNSRLTESLNKIAEIMRHVRIDNFAYFRALLAIDEQRPGFAKTRERRQFFVEYLNANLMMTGYLSWARKNRSGYQILDRVITSPEVLKPWEYEAVKARLQTKQVQTLMAKFLPGGGLDWAKLDEIAPSAPQGEPQAAFMTIGDAGKESEKLIYGVFTLEFGDLK